MMSTDPGILGLAITIDHLAADDSLNDDSLNDPAATDCSPMDY